MNFLTKQEELFLLTIYRLNEPAYLVNIREHLLKFTGKDWAFGSLYITLDKLYRKGYVKTYVGEPRGSRGGKAIKYYSLTDEGLSVLAKTKELQDIMWQGFSPLLERKKLTNNQ
jgi:DNA-binding PadR family transcriptional regulator